MMLTSWSLEFEEEGFDPCKPNFNTIWKRHETIVCKRNGVDIFCRLSTMHERDRQTNYGTVTLIAIREIATRLIKNNTSSVRTYARAFHLSACQLTFAHKPIVEDCTNYCFLF